MYQKPNENLGDEELNALPGDSLKKIELSWQQVQKGQHFCAKQVLDQLGQMYETATN